MDNRLYVPRPAELIRIEDLTQNEKLFEVKLLDELKFEHRAGQFVEVSIFGKGEAPISISSPPAGNGSIELCVRKVGNVTNAFHALKVGSKIGIRGPFGNGFPVEKMQGHNIVFVAGGIGIVPMRSLIKEVLSDRDRYKTISILYGAKSKADLLFLEEIGEWRKYDNVNVFITVDAPDPDWDGRVGVVTTLFSEVDFDSDKTFAVVVGPPIMYKFVMLGLGSRSISGNRIILSLERMMKCGIGKCGHCQIGSMYVCKDGPVFAYSEIRHMDGVV